MSLVNDMDERFVIDCAGRKVAIGDKRFAAKCWVGNTSDFLQANEANIVAKALSWQPLPKIQIIVPIYRSGSGFLTTLESLLSQNWVNPDEVEILLYVNEPPGERDALTALTLEAIDNIERGCLPRGQSPVVGTEKARLPVIRAIYEQLSGGLAAVYQRSFSSLIARIRQSADGINPTSKDEKVRALDRLLSSTIFSVVDDDIIFDNKDAFPTSLVALIGSNSALLGEVRITSVDTGFSNWDPILLQIMNLFFIIKRDLGTDVLTPRAALVRDLFHLPEIDPEIPYSDQIWFAGAVSGKHKRFIPVSTTVQRESYPSNAEMTIRLAQFLAGNTDTSALDLFTNLRSGYLSGGTDKRFTLVDIDAVISALSSRDAERIKSVASSLLSR